MTTIRSERIVDAPCQCPRCRRLDVIHFINEKLGEFGAKHGVVVILRRTLSVCPSVPLLFIFYFTVEPSYERTSKIEKLRFSLMGRLTSEHVCTFRHAQRAAYRTAISAAQILVDDMFDAVVSETSEDKERIRRQQVKQLKKKFGLVVRCFNNLHCSGLDYFLVALSSFTLIMRPSSLGGAAYCVALCLSVCLSVPLSLPSVTSFRQPLASRMYFSARTEGIRTFRHALRAAYRTALSVAQILVYS